MTDEHAARRRRPGGGKAPADPEQADSPNRSSRSAKLGEMVATRIEREIMKAGWPVGRVIGSESELLEKYQVSRAVFREAVRLLEHHGTAVMRRGPGGGLVVRRPDAHAVIRSVALYLDSKQISADQLFEARTAIELIAVQLAAERIDEEGVFRLRNVLAAERAAVEASGEPGSTEDIHSVLAQLSKNPAIQLFTQTLNQLELELFRSVDESFMPKYRTEFLNEHQDIAEAVIMGDVGLARLRMRKHLNNVAERVHPH